MSICAPCLNTQPVGKCTQEIVLGTITETDATLVVRIRNITTGVTVILDATSDGAGLITLDVSQFEFATAHAYEVSVIEAGESGLLDITIGAETANCVVLNFENEKNEDGEVTVTATATLALAE